MVQGTLYTISAPSGAGKTSLVKMLVEADSSLLVSVSHTTRSRRPGEVDGVNYHFVAQSEFDNMVSGAAFLEHATVFGNSYGTSKQWVSDQLSSGYDVILEIDWQGAVQVHDWASTQSGIESRGIFILPPSLDELRRRLTGRGQDEEQVIAGRMAQAVEEIAHYPEADYLVINDNFDTALADLTAIVRSYRLARHRQQYAQQSLLDALLKT